MGQKKSDTTSSKQKVSKSKSPLGDKSKSTAKPKVSQTKVSKDSDKLIGSLTPIKETNVRKTTKSDAKNSSLSPDAKNISTSGKKKNNVQFDTNKNIRLSGIFSNDSSYSRNSSNKILSK